MAAQSGTAPRRRATRSAGAGGGGGGSDTLSRSIVEHRRTLEQQAKTARAQITATERELKSLDATKQQRTDELKALRADLKAIEGAINSLAGVSAPTRRAGATEATPARRRPAGRRSGRRASGGRRQSAEATNAAAIEAAADWIDLAAIAKLLGRTHGRARQVMEGLVESGQLESRLQETPRKRFYRATPAGKK